MLIIHGALYPLRHTSYLLGVQDQKQQIITAESFFQFTAHNLIFYFVMQLRLLCITFIRNIF